MGPGTLSTLLVDVVLAEHHGGEAERRDVLAGGFVGEDLVVEGGQELARLGVVESEGGADGLVLRVPACVCGDAGEVSDGWALVPSEAEEVRVVHVVGDGAEEAAVGGVLEDVGGNEPVAVVAVGGLDPTWLDQDGVEVGASVGRGTGLELGGLEEEAAAADADSRGGHGLRPLFVAGGGRALGWR
ncbi:MAG: hypothetical protein PVG71_15660 [Anaerolineae bacterium]